MYTIKGEKPKLEPTNARWEYGKFLGVKRRSHELSTATTDGIEEVRSRWETLVQKRWGDDDGQWR